MQSLSHPSRPLLLPITKKRSAKDEIQSDPKSQRTEAETSDSTSSDTSVDTTSTTGSSGLQTAPPVAPATDEQTQRLEEIFALAGQHTAESMGNSIGTFVLAQGGQAMTDADVTAMFRQIAAAANRFSGLQLAGMLSGAAAGLGGRDMSVAHCNAMLSQLNAVCAVCNFQEMRAVLVACCKILGGADITPESRAVLLEKFHGILPAFTVAETRTLYVDVAKSLGGAAMTADTRDALVAQIVAAATTCSGEKLAAMTNALTGALGGTEISANNLNVLLAFIVTSYSSCTLPQVQRLLAGVAAALGNAAMSTENRVILVANCSSAHETCSAEQIRDLFYSLTEILRPKTMTPENCKALISELIGSLNICNNKKIGDIVCGIAHALGGDGMSRMVRETFQQEILNARTTHNADQVSYMIIGLTFGLAGRRMSGSDREAQFAFIMSTRSMLNQGQFGGLIRRFCICMDVKAMSEDGQAAFIAKILSFRLLCSGDNLRALVWGLSTAMGGDAMTVPVRNALLAQIFDLSPTSLSADNLKNIFVGLGHALISAQGTGDDVREAHHHALTQAILSQHRSYSPEKMAGAMEGVLISVGKLPQELKFRMAVLDQILAEGKIYSPDQLNTIMQTMCRTTVGRFLSTSFGTDAIAKILGASATLSGPHIAGMIEAVVIASGGRAMTPQRRDVLLAQILTAPKGCDDATMKILMEKLINIFGAATIPVATLAVFTSAVLDAHTQNSPKRMAAMMFVLAKLAAPQALLRGILRSGAAPIKIAAMITAVFSARNLARPEYEPARVSVLQSLTNTRAEIELENQEFNPFMDPYISAGVFAGLEDFARLLALPHLSAEQKLNIMEYAYANRLPATVDGVALALSKLINAKTDASLKVRAIVLFLKMLPASHGEYDGAFDVARLTQLGKLAGIVDKDGAGAAALGTWYTEYKELFYSYREHMTLEFIENELRHRQDEGAIPKDMQDGIRKLLQTRWDELHAGAGQLGVAPAESLQPT